MPLRNYMKTYSRTTALDPKPGWDLDSLPRKGVGAGSREVGRARTPSSGSGGCFMNAES